MQTKDLHAIPIATRPTKQGTFLRTIAFILVFDAACFIINGTQFVVAPVYLLSKALFERGMRYCKAAFGLACGVSLFLLPLVKRRDLISNATSAYHPALRTNEHDYHL